MVYGLPGIGKTSLGAAMPGRVFLIDDKEDGIHTLQASGLAPSDVPVLPAATSWLDVLSMLEVLASGEHSYKALVIDTLGGLERLCHEYVCSKHFDNDWGDKGFASYQRGYEVSLPYWREILNALDRLRNDRQMGVLCLAHSIVRPFKNPVGEDFDRYIPDLHHKTWALTHKWADMVLFLNYYVETTSKREGRVKGRGGQVRLMHTEYSAAWEAKNRHALPDEISMGGGGSEAWGNLMAAMSAARKAVQ